MTQDYFVTKVTEVTILSIPHIFCGILKDLTSSKCSNNGNNGNTTNQTKLNTLVTRY